MPSFIELENSVHSLPEVKFIEINDDIIFGLVNMVSCVVGRQEYQK